MYRSLVAIFLFAQLAIAEAKKPNFIIIYTDDLGYNDLGCYGSKSIKTPHIDKMASNGLRLLDFYAASASCTPSRAALMTGSYPGRVGMNNVLMPDSKDKHTGKILGLNPEETTIAEVVKMAGYSTACIGKWHLGDEPHFMPNNHGFDDFFGIPYSNDMIPKRFPDLPLMRNQEVVETNPDQDYLTKRLTEESIRFIEKNKDNPFFLYLAHPMPHRPCHASPEFLKRFSEKQLKKVGPAEDKKSRDFLYPASVEEIDWSTGEILKKLENLGLEENTLVIFTSDNGPKVGSAKPFSGKKGSVFEGGHRVPAVIQWKGTIPAGVESSQLITGMDFLPTFAHLAGATLPEHLDIDGINVSSYLTTDAKKAPVDRTFYYNHGGTAIRHGDWKYHSKKKALYNLKTDPGEKKNLAKNNSEKVQELITLLNEVQTDIKNNSRPAGKN